VSQSGNYLPTQCQVIASTAILAVAMDQVGAKRMMTFAGMDNPIGLMKAGLTAEVGKRDDIISVSFVSPYPEDAAQIVNAIVDSYVTYNSKHKQSTAAEILRILQNEKTKRDAEFNAKMTALITYREANSAISFETDKGGNVILQRLARLSEATTTAELETIEAKAVYEATKAPPAIR